MYNGSHPAYDSDSYSHSYSNAEDPFSDNAIPLQSKSHKPRLDATASPTGAMEEGGHQFPNNDRKTDKRSTKKDGWFRGKITWAVFVLTVVQIVVFIAEIIKNGKGSTAPLKHGNAD
jgi:hypothetical protein